MENYINEFSTIINDVSNLLGKPIEKSKYEIIDRGLPHRPKNLDNGKMGIYTFIYNGKFLKIGKAGPKSNARFLSQHYNPKSAKSTLASSLLKDKNMQFECITEYDVGEWIKNNCRRIDILLDSNLGIFTLELIEAIFHYKYEPIYEGYESQRE